MKKNSFILVFTLMLLSVFIVIALSSQGLTESNTFDLSILTKEELDSFIIDINKEIQLNHVIDKNTSSAVLSAVKRETENYFTQREITISWAWYDNEYTYTKEWDTYTLKTHIDYKDGGKDYKKNVYAEVFCKNSEFVVYQIKIGDDIILDKPEIRGDSFWDGAPKGVVNQSTGYDLSPLSVSDLNSLKKDINREISLNHTPTKRITSLVLLLAKAEVEQYFVQHDIEISWALYSNEYTYTRDWDYYSVKTHIDYTDENGKSRKSIVYAEVYKNENRYEVCFDQVDDIVLLDCRDKAKAYSYQNLRAIAPTNVPMAVPTTVTTTVPTAIPTALPTSVPITYQEDMKTKEYAKRAAIVCIINSQATDVFMADGNTLDPSKFHTYSESGEYMSLYSEGNWNLIADNKWHIDNMILDIIDYNTYLKASFDIAYDNNVFIIFNLRKYISSLTYINSNDPNKGSNIIENDNKPFMTVQMNMIEKDIITDSSNNGVSETDTTTDWVGAHFSPFDGSNRDFNKIIKNQLNDESSFKHIDTSIIDIKDVDSQEYVNSVLKKAGFTSRVTIGDVFMITEFSAKNYYNATIKYQAYGIAVRKTNSITLICILEK